MNEYEKRRRMALLSMFTQLELALGYTMMLFNREADRIATELKEEACHQERKNYSNILRLLKQVNTGLEDQCLQRIVDEFGYKGEPYDAKGYDNKLFEGNELARLIALYAEKTAVNNENYEKIFTMLGELKDGCNILDQSTYDHFYLQ